MAHTGLSVVEARWWDEGNHSVRGLFETVTAIVCENPYGFRYDMFSNRSALECVLSDIAQDEKYHSIYIASHGSEGALHGLGNEEITRAAFRNSFRNANGNFTVTGLYFGSCYVCNRVNAEFFLDAATGCNINWMAGYSKSVDWVDSSSIDMIFWSKLLTERQVNSRRRRGKKNDLEIALHAAGEVRSLMPTIFDQLGFNMYYRDGGGVFRQVW